ncbi:GEVED domain-containing protein [Chryseobacterium sp. KACC 21268]|nr:GEVED domain-containing protein [Chryseobacterium sp. KACC 21268]
MKKLKPTLGRVQHFIVIILLLISNLAFAQLRGLSAGISLKMTAGEENGQTQLVPFTAVTSDNFTTNSNVVKIAVDAFDCSGKIYSLAGATGEIKAFIDPATSGTLGTVVNTTAYPVKPASSANGANALGYSNLTNKFYYVQIQATSGNNTFVSYDPATNLYETLAGTTGTIYRGTVTTNGSGYYAITNGNVLKYYSITNNTWTTITSTYVDQNGASLTSLLASYGGGDIAMDGNGDLWILAGTGSSPTAYVFRAKSPVPTTNMGATPLVLEQIVKQDIGSSPNGIAFSPTGEMYITTNTTLFRMNGDFTISSIGAISPAGGGGDLTSCAFPISPFAVSDFGDAPDTYKTFLTSDGPRHRASQYDAITNTASLMIGNKLDLEINGSPNTSANGDDLSNINDENSISITTLYTSSTSYTAVVPVVNTTGGSATLKGWIDFNKNGIFDSSESATVTVPNGATSVSLTWTGLSGLTAGDTYYRLRIAKNAADITLPTGSAFGGEVEDGKLTIPGYCYDDPTLDPGQLYPVKHGITVLGRANAGDWPTIRNSAYTALESKTKGFVITRNSNPETTIAIPVVGMMVFDTDENAGAGCIKIYTGAGTGEGWKCFNTQGCSVLLH